MGREIERKFLVAGDAWRTLAEGEGRALRQFYLAARDGFSARVRLTGEAAILTIKTGAGLVRGEYEYPIPLSDARELEAARIGETIEKTRHRVDLGGGLVAEIDVFAGALAPLVLAEIELAHPERPVTLPDWLGAEVTHDPRYTNGRLALAGAPPPVTP